MEERDIEVKCDESVHTPWKNSSDWIVDASTGKCYNSLRKAASDTHVGVHQVSRSLHMGVAVNGHEFMVIKGYKYDRHANVTGYDEPPKRSDGISLTLCYARALEVDFLTTKSEVRMYARALFEAAKWGGIAEEKIVNN